MEHTQSAASPPASIDPFEGVVETFNEADIRATRSLEKHTPMQVYRTGVISTAAA